MRIEPAAVDRLKAGDRVYDGIAEGFDATRRQVWPECREFIGSLSCEKKGLMLLDLACGNGRNSALAAEKGLSVFCGDSSLKLLMIAGEKTGAAGKSRIPLARLDMRALPYKDSSFDAVMFIAAVHHLESEEDRILSLMEVARVLKQGGKVLVSAWRADAERFREYFRENKSRDVNVFWDNRHPRFYHLFLDGELSGLTEKAGLKVVRSFVSADGENSYVAGEK